MSRFTSTSEFDINRRVQITNETPVYNLFEALNSTMQNDFYEWFLGNEEVRYNVPYSIKQENPNGKYEDNSVAGTVGRFDIIRDEQESDGKTKIERLEKNQVYFKYVNGGVSPIYGPKPTTELDGPNTHYHSMKLTGVLVPEYDLLLHQSYRYLECLYPDHPDWTYLLTQKEFDDQIRAAGKMIDYLPKNNFFDKVAKSLSNSFTNDELIDEASMIKIRDLKNEAYRRKFYGSYAGYKMLGNDIFQHISVFPVATYLPINPVTKLYTGMSLDEINSEFAKDNLHFNSLEDFYKYERTHLRTINTFSKIYGNKFKLIDYLPKSYGNFSGYKTFKYFTSLWTNSIFECVEDYEDVILQSSNISRTSVIKDSSESTYQVLENGVNGIYYWDGSNISITNEYEDSEVSYFINISEKLPKSEIEFEVFNLFDEYVTTTIKDGIEVRKFNLEPGTQDYNNYMPYFNRMISFEKVSRDTWSSIFKVFPKEVKKTYKNPLCKNTLYLDPESTLKCYRDDKLYNDLITKEYKDIYKIYKTINRNSVEAALLYNFTPGFLKCKFNETIPVSSNNQEIFNGIFAISILNNVGEEFILTLKGNIEYEVANEYSIRTFNGDFRIITIPEYIEPNSKFASLYKESINEEVNNYERFFDKVTGEILIDDDCKITKICKIDGLGSSESAEVESSNIKFTEVPFFFDYFGFNEINFGWGNFLPLIEDGLFTFDTENLRKDVFIEADDGMPLFPIISDIFSTGLQSSLNVNINKNSETYLYSNSELTESINNYIKSSFDTFDLYPSDSQTEIMIEGVVNLNIKNVSNLITFNSDISKERLNTISIGDIVTGNCVDSDDETVFVTEIGSDYIRVSNNLITSGTFNFKFNTKINSVKIEEDNPLDFIDRLKGVGEYEFYNPFQHGIYSNFSKTKKASKAYVNGISNINSWRPYIDGGRYNDILYSVHNFDKESNKYNFPSTIKFSNDLFIEYNADKVLYYPTRSGKEECLMSVDWLDYLENRVNEASRLSDNTSVGVCVSLQTDTSGKYTIDSNINSKFKVLEGFWNKVNGKSEFPIYARIGNGLKSFKQNTTKFEFSGIGKSVYGKSKYSEEVNDFDYKDNINPVTGKVISPTMDYYGDNENQRMKSETKLVAYKDIDSSLFEINLGENDIISNYNVDNKFYTLVQVNICKQNFKNILKYSSFESKKASSGEEANKYIVADDNRWTKVLNISETERNIFIKYKNLKQINARDENGTTVNVTLYNNINTQEAAYRGTLPVVQVSYKDNGIEKKNLKLPDTSSFTFSDGILYYWILTECKDIEIWNELTQKNENFEISDSAILTLIKETKEDNSINYIWNIKNLKYCNNIGLSDDELRFNGISLRNDEKSLYKELGPNANRIYGEDAFLQFILQSLGLYKNEESLKQCTYGFEKIYNEQKLKVDYYDFLHNISKFELCLIKFSDKISNIENLTLKEATFRICKYLISEMHIIELKDGTPVDDSNTSDKYKNSVIYNFVNDDFAFNSFITSSSDLKNFHERIGKYIIVERIADPVRTAYICDLKETIRTAEYTLRRANWSPEPESDIQTFEETEVAKSFGFDDSYIEKFIGISSTINLSNLRELIDNSVFLFTTNDISTITPMMGLQYGTGRIEQEDIVCFFKSNEQFFIYKLNPADVFSSEIDIERFSYIGVYDEEWAKLKNENYNSIGISKKINSTYKLPRKYLNDNYEFDIILNPQFIGKGYEYKEDGTINKSESKNIEISRGSIYYDEENDEFFTWTYEIEDIENVSPKQQYEIFHRHDSDGNELPLKKYAIVFSENKYFKNVLFSSGSYFTKERIDSQNNKITEAFINAENELSLNIDKISSNDKVLQVSEVKLRPVYSENNEASFLSNYSEFTSKVTGIDIENNKLIFEPQKISEKSELLGQVEELLPCTLVNGKVTPNEVPADGKIVFESNKPIIKNDSFKRLPVLTNDFSQSESISQDFQYFKNNLIFVGEIDRHRPDIILPPSETELFNKYQIALSKLNKSDRLIKTELLENTIDDANNIFSKSFVVNGKDNIMPNTKIYLNNEGKFIGFYISSGTLYCYIQDENNYENKISFNTPVELRNIGPAGSAISTGCNILGISYFAEKSNFVIEVSIGSDSESTLYEVSVDGPIKTYKKLFGTQITPIDLTDKDFIKVHTNATSDNFDDYEIIKATDIQYTLTEELSGENTDEISYIDSNNPTSAYEPLDDGRFIFAENKSGVGYIDYVLVKGNKLFIYSVLNNYTELGIINNERPKTNKKYWHSIDLSNFISNSNNNFYKNEADILSDTKKIASNALIYLDSISEPSTSERYKLVNKIKNYLDTINTSSTINVTTGFGLRKSEDGTLSINPIHSPIPAFSNLKDGLIFICELLGAEDYIKRIISSPITDLFISGNYLFLKERNNIISYIELDKLISYDDYSQFGNWKSLDLSEYSYDSLDTNGITYNIKGGTTEQNITDISINIPVRVKNSIFNIKEVASISGKIYVSGNLISKYELENGTIPSIISQTESEPTQKLQSLSADCLDGNKTRALSIEFDGDSKNKYFGTSENENTYFNCVRIFNNKLYFFACFNDGTLSPYGILTPSQSDSNILIRDDNDEAEVLRNIYNTDEYNIVENNISKKCWISKETYSRFFITTTANDLRFSTGNILININNGEIRLNNPAVSRGFGKVKMLFAFFTQSDISDVNETIDTNAFKKYYCYANLSENKIKDGFEVSSVDSFHNADRVYSFNQRESLNNESFTNNIHFYPYYETSDAEFNNYYEDSDFLNDSNNVIRYCDENGILDENTGIIAKTPKYFSVLELNKHLKVDISDVGINCSSIDEMVYSANPYVRISANNIDYFKDYLVSGEFEIRDYIQRNFSFVNNTFTEETLESEDKSFTINGENYSLVTISGDENLYLYNKDFNYFPIDNDVYYEAKIYIPYLFNTKSGNSVIDTDFSEVENTSTQGIYLPKLGYGGYRGNNDEWLYNKPWDIDSVAFDDTYLYNKEGEPIYLVGKNGEKIISNNGEQEFTKKEFNSKTILVEKKLFGKNKFRTISIRYNNSAKKSITVEKLEDTKPKIYCPFIDNGSFFNNFIFKVMKDASNILVENDSRLKVYYSLSQNNDFEAEFTQANFKYSSNTQTLSITFDEGVDLSQGGINLKFEFEEAETLIIKGLSSSNNNNYYSKVNSILSKDIIYIYNKKDNQYMLPYDENSIFNIEDRDIKYIIIDDNNKILSKPQDLICFKDGLKEKVDYEVLNISGEDFRLNINFIDNIYIYQKENNGALEVEKYIIDDTLYNCGIFQCTYFINNCAAKFKNSQSTDNIFNEDKIKLANTENIFMVSSDIISCNKIPSNGVELYKLPNNFPSEESIIVSGIQSEIKMRKPIYKDMLELLNSEGAEISSNNIIFENGYKSTDLYISNLGNNQYKLNNLIYCNQPNIENNLNDGETHFIKLKLLSAKTILPSNQILSNNNFFVEIDEKDLIEWCPDRVYFNENGIKLPPVKIGNKIFREDSIDDYNKSSFKNNNGYNIYECDVNGNYITYYEDNSELKDRICNSVNYLFNPQTPKNELNRDTFKNKFYVKGQEQNPFWQIIRIKKEYNISSEVTEEVAKVLEYKKYSDSINLVEAEHPYIDIYKTSSYEEREELVFLNKNVNFVNTKKGEIKFTSKFNDRDYYSNNDKILKYGIEITNTLKNKIESGLDRIPFSSFERCTFEINNLNSNKTNSDDSIIEVSELGLFNKDGQMMAYATFPPIEYRTDSQHLSFLLYIYDGTY